MLFRSVVARLCPPQAHLQGGAPGDGRGLAGRALHEPYLPALWLCAKQDQRPSVSLPEMRLDVPSRWCWQHQHPAKVSGSRPSSWRYGTAHQHPIGCWCSSHGETVRVRKRLSGQLHRSRRSARPRGVSQFMKLSYTIQAKFWFW